MNILLNATASYLRRGIQRDYTNYKNTKSGEARAQMIDMLKLKLDGSQVEIFPDPIKERTPEEEEEIERTRTELNAVLAGNK